MSAYFSFSWTLVLNIVRYSRDWYLNSCQPLPWVLLWLLLCYLKNKYETIRRKIKITQCFWNPESSLALRHIPKADWPFHFSFFFFFPVSSQFLSVPQKIVFLFFYKINQCHTLYKLINLKLFKVGVFLFTSAACIFAIPLQCPCRGLTNVHGPGVVHATT